MVPVQYLRGKYQEAKKMKLPTSAPAGQPTNSNPVLNKAGQAELLLDFQHQLNPSLLPKVKQGPCQMEKATKDRLYSKYICNLESLADEIPLSTKVANALSLSQFWMMLVDHEKERKRKEAEKRQSRIMEYECQIDVADFLDHLETSWGGMGNLVGHHKPMSGEHFQEFLKKRTLEEFGNAQSMSSTSSAHPRNDNKAFSSGRPNPPPASNPPTSLFGAKPVQPAPAAPAQAVNLEDEDKNSAVINKFGGFTNARAEYDKKLKQNPFMKGYHEEAKESKDEAEANSGPDAHNANKNFVGNLTNGLFNVHGGSQPKNGKKFTPPVNSKDSKDNGKKDGKKDKNEEESEKYPGLEAKLVDMIEREILSDGVGVEWDDIAGLVFAKKTIQEIIVWPLLRPELFKGLRQPPKGLLLFGPPGTGKTMIGRAIASQLKYTFFSISASSLTSKWVGEGEKLVKTLFQLAIIKQPSVIFIDEIDSLLCSRSENDNESSRRIKTEFLVQLDGARSTEDDKILLIGATNRPDELDEAARRRFSKRIYIPLPDASSRRSLINRNITNETKNGGSKYNISETELQEIIIKTKGYSAADMQNLMCETAMVPLREVDIHLANADMLRPVCFKDFLESFKNVKSSVGESEVERYLDWNKKFGNYEVTNSD